MIRIVCALVDNKRGGHKLTDGVWEAADVDLTTRVLVLLDLVQAKFEQIMGHRLCRMRLYSTQQADGTWPEYQSLREQRPHDLVGVCQSLDPTATLLRCFGSKRHGESHTTIHVLAVATTLRARNEPIRRDIADAERRRTPQEQLATILQQATHTGRLPISLGRDADPDAWSFGDCGSVKDLTDVASLVPSLPLKCFVRVESLMVWRVFRDCFQWQLDYENGVDVASADYEASHSPFRDAMYGGRQLLLVGSPGVGKSVLLLLMSLWLAVKQKRDVAIVHKPNRSGSVVRVTTLLAGTSGKFYTWCDRSGSTRFSTHFIHLLRSIRAPKQVWICMDHVTDPRHATSICADLFSASETLDLPLSTMGNMRECLVPFWTQRDLWTLGQLRGFDLCECEQRYTVAGGCLRSFLGSVDDAVQCVDAAIARERSRIENNTRQLWWYEAMQVMKSDHIYMRTVHDVASQRDYVDDLCWKSVVTSEYARQRLSSTSH